MASTPDTTGQRRRVRRVTRVIRDIDAWSVFKVGLVFHAALYVVLLITGVLLWNVGSATGTIDNVEQFMESFGWDSFTFKGGTMFQALAVLGIFGIALGTGIWVLAAVVFNLITELVGGIRVTVLEEEVVARSVEAGQTQG
ncbi:MAG: hypothetical protein F2612_01825 [Actinobacteria bacterium]|uniref:Unannotated protein n=1 Tax=freshwater metagenome TaxID=449393 RepID=A0A6J6J4M5_9ZZZZ|nr:hypothetical protein [Actinomycetota bacterium]